MEAIILLCDFAEAINNKLYMVGAGFGAIIAPQPVSMSLAIRLTVPWNATNQPHKLHVGLETEDGKLVRDPDQPENPQVATETQFEVGRPPGMKVGSPIIQALAFRLEGLDIPTGGYAWVVKVDDTEIARASFDVTRVNSPGGQP